MAKRHVSQPIAAAAALLLALASPLFCQVSAAEPLRSPARYNDSGAQLNRPRQYLEYERLQQRLQEEREAASIKAARPTPDEKAPDISFTLKSVDIPPSEVLPQKDFDEITSAYVGRDVTMQDLYEMVGRINALYVERGYITCRAFLQAQTIHDGQVHLDLIEGKTGEVTIEGDRSTNKGYIRSRLGLKEGKVANINGLNKDLLRFNGTNDAQLRIALKAGEKPGTTDYVITTLEPQRTIFGVFADNAGNKTSGEYRGGFFWQDRSLTGNRDSLFLGTTWTEGTKTFSSSYAIPLTRKGLKAGIQYSTNSVHLTDGPLEPLNVRGHSYQYTFFLNQPITTTEKVKADVGLEYGYQHSRTDFMHMPWVDDEIKTWNLYYERINYGKSSIFYQKHGCTFGKYTDISDENSDFRKYELTTLYQKIYRHGQSWTVRLDGQFTGDDYLPSAALFYIGGLYSVRGYKESILSGDSGLLFSAEYSVPISKSRKTNFFTFLDYGDVWGESAFDDHTLVGAGIGIKRDFNDHFYASLALGIPLIRTINDVDQDGSRIYFALNSRF